MYFNQFPTIEYDVTGNGTKTTIKDLLLRVKVRDYVKNNRSWFAKYIVEQDETPDMVAFKVYGRTTYHWIILMFNQITNPYYDWPLKNRDFYAFINDKYSNPSAVHHYEIPQESGNTNIKIKVESDVAGAVAVTNQEFEDEIQKTKREIRILKPEYVGRFRTEFETLIEK
jgi:hypothetical protein